MSFALIFLNLLDISGKRRRGLALCAEPPSESEVVVIGSGLAGLTCAGVLAAAGKQVTVLESHYHPGGAAHTFRARAKGVEGDFCFDSGPSLYGGLSGERTSSPLKHVYQILGEETEWIQYDRQDMAGHGRT